MFMFVFFCFFFVLFSGVKEGLAWSDGVRIVLELQVQRVPVAAVAVVAVQKVTRRKRESTRKSQKRKRKEKPKCQRRKKRYHHQAM